MFKNNSIYWNKEIKNGFTDRDSIGENNYYVFSYMQSPPPCCMEINYVMNFNSLDKMLSYIKFVVVRRAVGDALELPFEKTCTGDFDRHITKFLEKHKLESEQSDALALWYEIDKVIMAPDEQKCELLNKFKAEFDNVFNEVALCSHGFDIVFSNEKMISFWIEFFNLDKEDDADEIEELKEALSEGDTDALDELMSYHC